MIATAPGKLILTGEYAVLDGAPALVVAIDRRVTAHRVAGSARGSSPFLVAVMDELSRQSPGAARIVPEISVDSSAFYQDGQKLGLGSSAAVTVAATALALAEAGVVATRDQVFQIAFVAHANAQGAKGARGSGADIAAATYGGLLSYAVPSPHEPSADPSLLGGDSTGAAEAMSAFAIPSRRCWPAGVRLLPFFTGRSADTATLVSRVVSARTQRPDDVGAALAAIASASDLLSNLLVPGTVPIDPDHVIAGFKLAGIAVARLASATGVDLVPPCVTAAAAALATLGGMAKTTGAGGGDVGIAVIPATADESLATRILIESGCQPLPISVDDTGVDTRPGPQ